MRHLLIPLLAAAISLPLLSSCTATVDPGYGYAEPAYSEPAYYGPTYGYYSYYDRYPRYHEHMHPYRPYAYHHDDDDRARAFDHHGPEVHGHIAIER